MDIKENPAPARTENRADKSNAHEHILAPKPDPAKILEALDALFDPDDVIELRVIHKGKKRTDSRYFDAEHRAQLAEAATRYNNAGAVYVVMNTVKPELLGRYCNRMQDYASTTTSDHDILRRRWFLIDLDPVRPAGIGSTDDQLQIAKDKAEGVRDFLAAEGWSEPVLCESGNGIHLLYPVDLPNDDQAKSLVELALKGLAERFDDALVKVDTSVFNAARITKLYGTVANKGDHTARTPWRISRIVSNPGRSEPVSPQQSRSLHPVETEAQPASSPASGVRRNLPPFDLEGDFLRRLGIEYTKDTHQGRERYKLRRCPFNPEQANAEAAIFRDSSGRLGYKCQHNSCADKKWRDVRALVDFSEGNRRKFSSNKKNPTLPTLSRLPSYTEDQKSYTDDAESYTVEPDAFLYQNEDGAYRRVIESVAALTLAEAMRGRFAYASQVADWHLFTGTHWQPRATAEAEKFIAQAFYVGTKSIGFRPGYMAGTLKIMLAADWLPLPTPPAGKIPFRNGLLDPVTRTLEPVTPDNAATWCIPHDHTAGSDCPVFMRWLRTRVGDDAELIRLVRAIINACLTGRADLQKFLHLLGPGGTGKSTLIRLLLAMLGPSNFVTTGLRQLEQNRFETASLYGKRLAAITDSDKYGGAVNVLKAITGQDPVRNEKKHVQQSGTFIFEGMVIIASNEPLQSTDYTSGLERRRLVIKFDRRIPPEEKAAFLAAGGEEQLHREIPAIINWALELGRDEVTDIFMHPPRKAAEAAFDSLMAQNPIAEWISERLIPAQGHWVAVGAKNESRTQGGTVIFEDADTRLYPNYLQWTRQNGREALSLRRFRNATVDMLKTMGADVVECRRSMGQGIQGIRLRNPGEPVHSWVCGGSVQDESYTSVGSSVGFGALEAAPVSEVQEVLDFSKR